jgi:hypothetical protein
MDILLEEDDRSVICGIVLIIDHFNTTLKHMVQYSPSFAKKTITLLQVRIYIVACSIGNATVISGFRVW